MQNFHRGIHIRCTFQVAIMQVEVIDSKVDYLTTLGEVFDFGLLKSFLSRPDFNFVFDALHAVTGAYAGPLFVEKLGAGKQSIQ